MKLSIVFYFILFVNFHFFSQSIDGLVKDNNNNGLFKVTIINQSSKAGVTSDLDGKFNIYGKIGDILRFSYIGKETKFYEIQPEDTIFLTIKLNEELTELKEFIVDGKRIKKVSALNNENIIDYYSLGINTFLILKRVKKKYIISIEGYNKVYKTFKNIKNKPIGLFYDFKDNFFLLAKDSVIQFDFDESIINIDLMSFSQFKEHIYPMLYYNDSIIIKYSFLNHNKTYDILKFKKDKKELIYSYSDIKGIENANQNYQEVISLYMKTTPNYDNIILNKTWDGDINKLSHSLANPENEEEYMAIMMLRKKLFQSVSFYDKISSREVEITSFFLKNVLLSFNFNNYSLTVQNINGDTLHKTKLKILNKGFAKKVVLDREQNTFFAYSLNNGVVTLDKINLQTGKTTDSYELKGVTFPKNLKVIDGWAYFINPNKNGYHKLYRIALG